MYDVNITSNTPGNRAESTDNRISYPTNSSILGEPSPLPKLFWLLVCLIGIIGTIIFAFGERHDAIITTDEDGNVILAPERAAKLAKELEEIDNAEQYVLYAISSKYYPCYACPGGQKTIFLLPGEVWRYGTTRVGEKRRYPNQNYGTEKLRYVVQYEGPLNECIKQEKIKIYNYPLLPEALARNTQLIRPPGNKNDN